MWGWDKARFYFPFYCGSFELTFNLCKWQLNGKWWCLLVKMYLLLQTWVCRGQHTGHPGFSCQWQQAFHHCQQQPEGDIIIIPCHAFLKKSSFHSQLKCLSCSSSSPCVSFPFSLSAFLPDVCCLLFISGHRAVWNHWKAAGELQ